MQAVKTIREKSEMVGEKRGVRIGMQTRDLEIAERMLKLYIDTDTIQQATGLLKEEVIQLKKKLGL